MLKSKRGPNKLQNPYTIQDMYREYISHFDESHPYHVPYSEYCGIVSDYLKYLSEQVVVKSMSFKLPFRMGEISVCKHKPVFKSLHKMSVDWKKTKEMGKIIYNFNDHSGGFRYKFVWNRMGSNDKHMKMYAFKPSRSNARLVASLVKERKNDYFELA